MEEYNTFEGYRQPSVMPVKRQAKMDTFQPEHDLIERYKSGQEEIRNRITKLFGREGQTYEQDNNINEANQLLTITMSSRVENEEPEQEIRNEVRQRLAHLMLGLSHKKRLDNLIN